MKHPGNQARSPNSIAAVTWMLLLVCAGFAAHDAEIVLRTLPDVEAGRVVFSPGAFLFLVLLAMTVLKLLCALALCAWAVRVARNLELFGVTNITHTPLELVGLWFVPILNWATLYLGLSQLWRSSATVAEGAPPGRRPVLLIAWLFVWITHGMAIIATVLYFQPDQYIWFIAWLVRDVALVAAAPLLVAVMVQIGRMQGRAR